MAERRKLAANDLLEGTKLKDPDYRKQLAAGGHQAIETSTDPTIRAGSHHRP